MNVSMWRKALQIIPRISKEEWDHLDVISRWLISTRAAVLIMTFLSGAIAGILAINNSISDPNIHFNLLYWIFLEIGLVMAHATNNLFNDYTDYTKGVDKDNYYRAQYGPQPLVHGLMTKSGLLTYAAITGLIALIPGIIFIVMYGLPALILLALGAFFVLFYTYPLKYIALGELSVLIVWGPLMIAGGYFVITGVWDWNVVIASLPYAIGVTGVIFGKHIDKSEMDRSRRIFTLPAIIGEKAGRYLLVALFILQYISVIYLILVGFFSPVLLIVFLAIPTLLKLLPMFKTPKPAEKPADYPDVWPNYFVAAAFVNNRAFGLYYLLGLILNIGWKLIVK